MDDSLERQHYRFLTAFRVICYLCALYFLAMGVGLMLFPAFVARVAGPQNPIILGMLRGAGGSIVPYALLYVIVARSPISRRWGVAVIAVANTVAIVLDVASVYRVPHAPFEAVVCSIHSSITLRASPMLPI
jgi:hypothetical protein